MDSEKFYGLGKSVAAMVLSYVAFVVCMIGYVFAIFSFTAFGEVRINGEIAVFTPVQIVTFAIIAVVLVLLALAMTVFAIVFGIGAVKNFITRPKQGYKRPLLPFIFGLVALYFSLMTVIFALISMGIGVGATISVVPLI